MRFLAALALLVLGVAYAHHTPQHKLRYPGFVPGKTHLYDVTINMTSGVPGMSPQVAKAVIKTELKVFAKTAREVVIQMNKVHVSDSLGSVGSPSDDVNLKSHRGLEESLKVPSMATFENGMIKSYTLNPRESLESQKIRRTILRNLEVYLDSQYVEGGAQSFWPLTYNVSRSSDAGKYYSHYVITSSPYAEFPKEMNVFNISRTDNFEVVPYLAYKSHHNFVKQGCPEVCNENHIENNYGAGCPIQHEPHHTPMKRSFVQHHNLRMLKSGVIIIDSVKTKETHVADVYDQNMEVTIKSTLRFVKTTSERLADPAGQQVHSDLHEIKKEIHEQEIQQLCKYPDTSAAITEFKRLIERVADIVLRDEVKDESSKQIGEMLVKMQKHLQILKQGDLRTIQSYFVKFSEMTRAAMKDKIKRQIWLDLLPVIGTPESVSFIVHFISENINLPNKQISLLESKTILEALPQNIHKPTERTLNELTRLLEVLKDRKAPGYSIFYSAVHMTMARVIRKLCVYSEVPQKRQPEEESYSFRFLQRDQRSMQSEEEEYRSTMIHSCPKAVVKRFIEQIGRQLHATDDKTKRVIYIETLANTGLEDVLPILRPYIYGHSWMDSTEVSLNGLSQSYIDWLKTVAIYALHNVVDKAPRKVQELMVPVFFNKTEPPKVRTAAFSVIIRSQPTLGLLQQIAAQSWDEPSEEVGSYVTSTMHTFGNSSQPCNQLISYRIRKVLPQLKRFDLGNQKAKNILWDLWDEQNAFGLEKRCEYTPSNESFIPSTVYGSLGYNVNTLKDYLFQYAFNVQGLTSRNVYDALLKKFGLSPAVDIPKESEREIFPELDIASRDPEFWRLTAYQKLFYSTSYYYFDGEETNKEDILNLVMEQLSHHVERDSEGNFLGHFVKVWLPSSYHVKTVAHALPYPVEFEMWNPLLISMKLKMEKSKDQELLRSGGVGYELHLSPSVYHSILYTTDILNLGDCKKVGVYHEQKAVASYPVVLSFNVYRNGKYSFSYKFPELPKNVFSLRSEAGTYAGKNFLAPLPPKEEKRTIKTIPSQFVKPISIGVIGLPKFEGEIKSEDIQFGMDDIPRDAYEAAFYSIKHTLNGGWRRKSVEIARVPDSAIWVPNTEVKINVNYLRSYISYDKKSSESDWSKDMKFDDNLDSEDSSAYAAEGQRIYHKLTRTLSHIKDTLKIKVEQKVRSAVVNKADMHLEYAHTLGGFLHVIHFNASAALPKIYAPVAITADYAVGFIHRPNEFKYSEQYGKQKGLALGAVSFSRTTPFLNPSVIAKAIFDYKPLHQVLHMDPMLPPREFEPETHEECLKDVQKGKSLSSACVKAIREKSIYNHLRMHAISIKESPEYIKEILYRIDLALKHTLYSHMNVTRKSVEPRSEKLTHKSLRIEGTYIDKMTDEPVVDVVLDKPTEILRFKKVSAGWMQPLSSIETLVETYQSAWSNNTYPATCAMMDNYVRTYDMKTYRMPSDTPACTYVLSSHCTEHKKFAVLVKYTGRSSGAQEIHMHVGKDKIVLVPGSKLSYKVRYNGQEQTVRILAPLMLSESGLITALVNIAHDGNSFIEINAKKAGLKVRYDGSHVKVQVHPRYKGELCGLCSEFNGELTREFRGVDRCLYTNAEDFAKSSIIGKCVDKTPVHPFMCNNGDVSEIWGRKQSVDQESEHEEGYEPTLKRNVVVTRESKLCFSTKPVPVCDSSAEPLQTESQEIDFHCLPRLDMNAKKMVIESKRRILGELETKIVDHSETIEIAKMC